jgi:preprotein translocase subunit SecD
MKRLIYLNFLLALLLIISTMCFADSITLDFRIEQKMKSIGSVTAYDRKTGEEIYFKKTPSLTIQDIKKAECRLEKVGDFYTRVKSIYDENVVFMDDMIPTIDFYLTEAGKNKIFIISSRNDGKRLGIFLNNKLIVAPTIHGKIEGGVFSLQAAGSISVKESKDLVERINKK